MVFLQLNYIDLIYIHQQNKIILDINTIK